MTYRLLPLDRTLLDQSVALARETPWRGAAEGDAFAARVLDRGMGSALIDGGRLLGCGGIVLEWYGRGLVWLIVTQLARKRDIVHGVEVARDLFARVQEDPAFRRLELFVCADREWCHSFARALGFALEARCAAFGPDGRDYFMFSRVAQPLSSLPNGRVAA